MRNKRGRVNKSHGCAIHVSLPRQQVYRLGRGRQGCYGVIG